MGFELRPPPLPPEEMPDLIALIRLAFNQRRKTLRNALSAGGGRERAEAVLAAVGLPEKVRGEELGLAQYVEIHRAAAQYSMT